MNHKVTIGMVAVVAAMALTAVAFAIPQQALAGGHHFKHNNHNSNSIKVDQQINQQNQCSSPPSDRMKHDTGAQFQPSSSSVDNNSSNQPTGSSSDNNANNMPSGSSPMDNGNQPSTVCLNFGQNSADIHK